MSLSIPLSLRSISESACSATSVVKSGVVDARAMSRGLSRARGGEGRPKGCGSTSVSVALLGGRLSLRGGGSFGSKLALLRCTGDNSDSALVCLDPEKTVLFVFLVPLSKAFLLSISCCIHALEPSESSSLSALGRLVLRDCSFVTFLTSFFFFCASWLAHCLLSLLRSASARCSSSLSSSTLRSCVAIAVKKLESVGPVGAATCSGAIAAAISRIGEVDRVGLCSIVAGCTGNCREKRLDLPGKAEDASVDIVMDRLWL